jgi:hypothetical protein
MKAYCDIFQNCTIKDDLFLFGIYDLSIPFSSQMLDVSGRPNTRDYGKALEALKLLTENVLRGPHNRVMGTTCL